MSVLALAVQPDQAIVGDVDLSQLVLDPKQPGVKSFNVIDSITSADVEMTIEGASTVTLGIRDPDRKLLRSGLLDQVIDIEVDRRWFRLVATSKQGSDLTLTFEDRVVAILRTYAQPRKASRGAMTRAQFALALVREVRPRVSFFSPELLQHQPVGAAQSKKTPGTSALANDPRVTVKGKPATREQRKNMEGVLDVGVELNVSRKLLLSALVTIIQESSCINLPLGAALDGSDSQGCFQQRRSQGWPATRIVRVDAKAFYEHALAQERKYPGNTPGGLAQAVQHSAGTSNDYQQWIKEAQAALTAYGGGGGGSTGGSSSALAGTYEFTRGQAGQRESTWDCLLRLADEVNWRRYCVGGIVYFISETYLIDSKPRMRISEASPGVDGIDFVYDPGKLAQDATVYCRIGRWVALPGSVVVVSECGPADGRWLVSSIRRSLFSANADITLRRARPKLPEPVGSSSSSSGGPAAAPGTYVNPFTGAKIQAGRIDQGVDYHGTGPIHAIGKAMIIAVGGAGWPPFPGGKYLLYQLLDGPHAGRYIYVAEAIRPTVHAGQQVAAGAPIAVFGPLAAPGNFPGIETGWGSATVNLTRAAEMGNTGAKDHSNAPAGLAFARFLRSLGVPTAADPGPGPQYV